MLDVLPGTTSAAPEGRADRLGANRTGLQQHVHPGPDEAGPALLNPGAYPISRRGERNEHDATVGAAAHAVSARGEGLDLDLQDLRPTTRRDIGAAARALAAGDGVLLPVSPYPDTPRAWAPRR